MPVPCKPVHRRALAAGFTLVEVMVVVAIVAILAAVALPSYTSYILRSNVQEGLQALGAGRVRMEQYFFDNRSYTSDGTACGTGVGDNLTLPGEAGKFTISCEITGNGYTITATGDGTMSGFVYTINQANGKSSSITKDGWNSGTTCWITKPGESCS